MTIPTPQQLEEIKERCKKAPMLYQWLSLLQPEKDAAALLSHVAALEARLKAITDVVNKQAEDDGLWFEAVYVTEGALQQALRHLHAVIEGTDDFGRSNK